MLDHYTPGLESPHLAGTHPIKLALLWAAPMSLYIYNYHFVMYVSGTIRAMSMYCAGRGSAFRSVGHEIAKQRQLSALAG